MANRLDLVGIVGGGTVGKYLSCLLSSYNIPTLLLEAGPRTLPRPHPRAHVLNTRSMELMRELGVDQEIHAQAPPQSEWRHFRYVTSLFGQELGALDHLGGKTFARLQGQSPATLTHLSQPKLDRILLQRMAEYEHSGVLQGGWGQRCVKVQPNSDSVLLEVENMQTKTRSQFECSYVVAADGARSHVRESLGIGLQGTPELQHFVSVHFIAKGLAEVLQKRGNFGMLYFIFNARAIAVLVAHNVTEGEWVAHLPYFPPQQSAKDLPPTRCQELILECIGAPPGTVSVDILSVSAWTMNALTANRFSKGRVFLVGDAAHQFPPAGGFGLNVGLQDAHNLAWKLAGVVSGTFSDSILNSFDAERFPAAVEMRTMSVDNFKRGLKVPQAMMLPVESLSVFTKVLAQLPVPQTAQRFVIDTAVRLGAAQTQLAKVPGFLQKVRKVITREEALPMVFSYHDLGLEYNSNSNSNLPLSHTVWEEGVRQYTPALVPGQRLPHVWLQSAPDTPSKISSLDLVRTHPGECPAFTALLTPLSSTPIQLPTALRNVRAVVIREQSAQDRVAFQNNELCDVEGGWAELVRGALKRIGGNREAPEGCLWVLVRPDGYLAAVHISSETPTAQEINAGVDSVVQSLCTSTRPRAAKSPERRE
eukprot:c26035_g1_i1.p1 GENE.c26035_g1_i1~~c26035_g1_i1.p1  ORF type:complete len:648 (+),score=137.67 c26035_g1_i1:22-1965(+)